MPFVNNPGEGKQSNAIGCLELCMFSEGSRHQEEIIVTGTKVRFHSPMALFDIGTHGMYWLDATFLSVGIRGDWKLTSQKIRSITSPGPATNFGVTEVNHRHLAPFSPRFTIAVMFAKFIPLRVRFQRIKVTIIAARPLNGITSWVRWNAGKNPESFVPTFPWMMDFELLKWGSKQQLNSKKICTSSLPKHTHYEYRKVHTYNYIIYANHTWYVGKTFECV